MNGPHPDPPTWLGELPDPADDPAAAALTDTLEHDAEALQPDDRLTELRTATADQRAHRPWLVAAAACTVLVAVAGTVASLSAGADHPVSPPAVQGTDQPPASTAATPRSSASASSGPSGRGSRPTASVGQPVSYALPVYYLVQDGGQPGLAREWHRRTLSDPGQRMQVALDEATDPSAVRDAGSSAPWQRRTRPLRLQGPVDGVLTIDVPVAEGEAHGRSPQQAQLAAQQLVWTATAVQQDASMGVRILVGGSPGLLFGSYPVGDVLHRDAVGGTSSQQPSSPSSQQPVDFIAIDLPRPQDSLTSPLVVRGRACVFEASLSWELLSGSDVVRSGHLTASRGCPDTGTWSVRLTDVPAGQYTFRAYALPASGAADPVQDTVAFRVS